MSLNKVQLIGYVGTDPDLTTFPSGAKVTKFRFATTERVKAVDKNWENRTVWHSIECWERTADYVEKWIKKGDKLYLEGSLHYNTYTDKEGIRRTQTYISVSEVIRLTARTENGEQDTTTPPPAYGGVQGLTN